MDVIKIGMEEEGAGEGGREKTSDYDEMRGSYESELKSAGCVNFRLEQNDIARTKNSGGGKIEAHSMKV